MIADLRLIPGSSRPRRRELPGIALSSALAQTSSVPDEDNAAQRRDALEARIVDLEVRLSFQQQTIDDLDLVLREFAARVERLEGELRELRSVDPGAPAPAGPASDDFDVS